jgi:hypothetical protein
MDDLQLQERITDLERELVSTKLQLACAKSSICSLEDHLAMTRALFMATSSNVTTSHSESSRLDGTENDRNTLNDANHDSIGDSTTNPFSREQIGADLDFHRAWKAPHTKKISNPGSCASALNLFAKSDAIHPSADVHSLGWGTLSHRRPASNHMADRLNLNSCSSGLNIPKPIGLPPLPSPSMISMTSSITNKSSYDSIALLFGDHPVSKGSSSDKRRIVGSRNNASNSDDCCIQSSANRNAEWGVLK